MKRTYLLAATITLSAALAACNQAKSPDAVRRDMNSATESGSKQIADAQRREARTDAAAEADAQRAVDQANAREMDAAVNTAVTQAEAENKVELARCESLQGERQRACRDQANARLNMARAQAKGIKSSTR